MDGAILTDDVFRALFEAADEPELDPHVEALGWVLAARMRVLPALDGDISEEVVDILRRYGYVEKVEALIADAATARAEERV